ncbi:phage baseplate assembly protein V [Pseudomonas resinovorans]|uniref:Phage baseplate assembly protein V n=1 Tax=Metapseudomonas resinovorans TaxID=53412 RepID=A0ABT4Y407_METRE|nr:phage baseplate assembly protein V [Pseudomonas resinovorans]MDA8483586.1 phage baseplate assembly protein V [Pseudomonas resinovorans]
MLAPMARRLRLMVGRCLLVAADDARQRQNVQIKLLSGEVADDVEHYQQAGFTSVPLPGAVGLFLASGGKRSGLAALLLENKEQRLNGLEPGDAAIYHIGEGHHLVLEKDGVARLVCQRLVIEASAQVDFQTPLASFSGDIEVAGTSTATDHLSSGISGLGHLHTGNLGAPTSPPIGGGL